MLKRCVSLPFHLFFFMRGGGEVNEEQGGKKPKCQTVIKEYHEFLGATVKFLHEIQERQMLWNWGGDSGVFDGVAWLKGLWASRSTVCDICFLLPFPFLSGNFCQEIGFCSSLTHVFVSIGFQV